MPDNHYYSNSFPNMYKKMEKNNVSLYGDIIYRMVDLDEKTRITPEELYNTLSINILLHYYTSIIVFIEKLKIKEYNGKCIK